MKKVWRQRVGIEFLFEFAFGAFQSEILPFDDFLRSFTTRAEERKSFD